MEFEFIIPARSCKKDYLEHPSCPADRVRDLINQGLTVHEVAKELDTTTYIVKRVLRALKLQPSRVNYLSHPKCPPEAILEGRRLGKSYKTIASELGIAFNTVMSVTWALEASGVQVPDTKNPHSVKRTVDYLNHPKCPAAEVVRLRTAGRTMDEIASFFGVATPIISRVIHAVQTSTGSLIEPIPGLSRVHRFPHTDYLNHPKCPVTEVARLQELGLSIDKIAVELHICRELVLRVSRAMKDPSKRFHASRSFNSNPVGGGEFNLPPGESIGSSLAAD